MKKITAIIMILVSQLVIAKEVTVGLIDTGVVGINKEIITKVNPVDEKVENYHGTSLACILTQNPEIKVLNLPHKETFEGRIDALKKAIRHDVDYILYASSGLEFSRKEKYLIELAIKKGIKVVVSAGNQGFSLLENPVYPCSYNIEGVVCVGNKKEYSNKGMNVVLVEQDNEYKCLESFKGTSQSAAIYIRDSIKK